MFLALGLALNIFEYADILSRFGVTLRFGLVDGKSLTLDKVALSLNLSRERVLKIEHKALKKLRQQVVLQAHPEDQRKG